MSTVSALRQRFLPIPPEVTVDHLVVGGGVVGLAVGQKLIQTFKRKSTYIVERHRQPGQETSSRNSEVIHAVSSDADFFPDLTLSFLLDGRYVLVNNVEFNDLKLCLSGGRKLLYEYCRKNAVPYRKVGKLIVSNSREESKHLENLYQKCQAINCDPSLQQAFHSEGPDADQQDLIPLKILQTSEALDLEPDLSRDLQTCLFSSETGILDSHAFLTSLENSIHDSENGEIVYGARVVRIDKASNNSGWVVQTQTNDSENGRGECNSVLAKCVINCAGLNAHNIYNHVLFPKGSQVHLSFCKGNYFSYCSKKGVESVRHLIYPSPTSAPQQTIFSGLGTHLTLDMNQKIKFGPDVEWLPPSLTQGSSSSVVRAAGGGNAGLEEELQDFWQTLLKPNDSRLEMTYHSVKSYLPRVEVDHFVPDYSGIRPKLLGKDEDQNQRNLLIFKDQGISGPGKTSLSDFFIQQSEYGFINLLGIESPGLTSSLAIGEHVERLIRTQFWRLDDKGRSGSSYSDQRLSEIGDINSWA